MRRTELFRLQHAELAGLAERIESALVVDELRRAPEPARVLLTTLAGALATHSAQEDDRLYPLLFNHADRHVQSAARTLHRDFGVIYAAVEVFIAMWLREGALEADPARFVAETQGILATLRARIAREDSELYSLIDSL